MPGRAPDPGPGCARCRSGAIRAAAAALAAILLAAGLAACAPSTQGRPGVAVRPAPPTQGVRSAEQDGRSAASPGGAVAAPGGTAAAAAGLPCLKAWGSRKPYLSHLDVWIYGQKAAVPASVGFDGRRGCTYPMSTMDDTGILHVMALPGEIDMSGPYPAFRFTLGQFLAEAGAVGLPSGSGVLLGRPLTKPETAVTGWVNGILRAVGWTQTSQLRIPIGGELAIIVGPPWGQNAPFDYPYPAQHGIGQGGR